MSTLTKVLIVLMAVCSVVSAVVFIQFSNTTANYKEAYERVAGERDAMQATARVAEANLQTFAKDFALKEADAKSAMEQLKSKLDDAATQMGKVQMEIASLRNDKDSLQAANAALTTTLGQQTARADQLSRQLEERQALVQAQNGQLQEQDTRIKDLDRNLGHATQAAQKNHELVVSMEQRVKELEDKIRRAGITTVAETPRPTASEKIEGRVLDVLPDQNVAQLSVGSASGVEAGMVFILYRGSELVGQLSVAKVDATTSAGTLSDLQLTPQKGDIATTKLTTK